MISHSLCISRSRCREMQMTANPSSRLVPIVSSVKLEKMGISLSVLTWICFLSCQHFDTLLH